MRSTVVLALAISLSACASADDEPPFTVEPVATLDEPWALTFLPDGRMLVTQKSGELLLVSEAGDVTEIAGVPAVDYGGQGGLGDVLVHPDFENNKLVYLSYVESGADNTRGAVAVRGTLDLESSAIENLETVWTQVPKTTGYGHYGHRLLFGSDGYLWISSGDRQKFDPSQDMQANLGKILRLHDDGSPVEDNPFFDQGGVTAEIWSLGHRNPLGIDFDPDGRLWNSEMGPRGGDELNLVKEGANYGYPIVSNGRHYSGRNIPDHDTRPEFEEPAAWWTPVISPAGLHFYEGTEFPDWQGDALLPGLSAEALVRVEIDGESAREVARYNLGERIRAVEQAPDGTVWLLEDRSGGRLLRLRAK